MTSGGFRVGDRVRCVQPCDGLTKGRDYTVSFIDTTDELFPRTWGCQRIELTGRPQGCGYRSDRFIATPPETS